MKTILLMLCSYAAGIYTVMMFCRRMFGRMTKELQGTTSNLSKGAINYDNHSN